MSPNHKLTMMYNQSEAFIAWCQSYYQMCFSWDDEHISLAQTWTPREHGLSVDHYSHSQSVNRSSIQQSDIIQTCRVL